MTSLKHLVPALAVGALVLTGCSSTESPTTPATDASGAPVVSLVKGDVLTVCTNPPFEPFEFIEGDEIVGLDMDLTAEIAKDLGVEQQVIIVGFDAMESGAALNSSQCDVVATGMSITEGRKANIDFSEPYFAADLGLLVKSGSGIATEADLAGKKIGVQKATVGDTWVTEKGLTGVQFEDLGLQIQALNSGQVDAVINDFAVLGTYENDQLEITATFPTDDVYGIAVKKGNTALIEKVNATLARVKSDGTWTTIHTNRFGFAPAED